MASDSETPNDIEMDYSPDFFGDYSHGEQSVVDMEQFSKLGDELELQPEVPFLTRSGFSEEEFPGTSTVVDYEETNPARTIVIPYFPEEETPYRLEGVRRNMSFHQLEQSFRKAATKLLEAQIEAWALKKVYPMRIEILIR
ncbi:hypothetical protein EW145_g3648 [Phellinidium pouzarii]|uniref:Uncharacterized protein n=1 Tax=Phellinidium pouzarii TaxID=167371 RepID=A0A4S4L8B4_9AGAM|nr:hypothetical protein EW145_g3648 [Phellinidium pouzarii]